MPGPRQPQGSGAFSIAADYDIGGRWNFLTPPTVGAAQTPIGGGNAVSATVLETARLINGVSFDGSADITIGVSGGAGALSGTTLAANVVASSLTSVGTLTGLTTTGLIDTGAGGFQTIGTTANVGIYAQRSTRFGVQGVSTSQVGVYGTSTSSNGVRGDSLSGAAGHFTQTGALTGTSANGALFVSRASTLGAFDLTGYVLELSDTTAASGGLIRAIKGGLSQFTVGATGNLRTLGTVVANGGGTTTGDATTPVVGGTFDNYVNGSFGVSGAPHSNVLFHVLNNHFTPGAGSTTGYGAVIYPVVHALDPMTRLTGLMVNAGFVTPLTSACDAVNGVYLPIPAIVDGGGGAIGTGATLRIDGAPTFGGSVTDGLYAIKVLAGLAYFGGAVQAPAVGAFAASDKYLVIDAAGNIHKSALGPAS